MAASPPSATGAGRWPHWLAVIAAAATLLLIFVGGLVTNTGSGLAVPDWPTTFGHNMFLYPWSKMVGGVFYEHIHRLMGSGVGMLTVALAVWLWVAEPRRWVWMLGLAAVIAVIAQGILGGLRVVLVEHTLAVVHGCLAHAFLALLVSLAVCTSSGWHQATGSPHLPDGARLRAAALITAGLVYVQLVLGALLTHTGMWLWAHLVCAGVVAIAIAVLTGRVLRRHAGRVDLRRPAVLLLLLLGLQMALGAGAYLVRFTGVRESLPVVFALALPTTHRLAGAVLWATSVVLALRILRLVGVRQQPSRPLRTAQAVFPGRLAAHQGGPRGIA